jgi:TolB-like protein/Tfp pilus assembly protein PilF
MSLFTELKRRNVIRVAITYIAGAWLLTEVSGTLFPVFGIPDWGVRFVVIVLALGLLPALIISWAYELTPEGLKREKDVVRETSITHITAKRLDVITMVLIVFTVAFVLLDRLWFDSSHPSAPIAATFETKAPPVATIPEASAPDNSIAVLAFADMSPGKDQEYFADGLSDTLIHVLAQVSELKVTAMTSSFYFKDKDFKVNEVARELNVGSILEGSVQKAGNRVRVIAQLIDAKSGTHLWSKSFDRDLTDIFAVQDEIAREVVHALKITLLDTEKERMAQRYKPSLDAYEQLILGRQEMARRTAEGLHAAEKHFNNAIKLDPDYALAYVGLADTLALQTVYANLLDADSVERRHPLIEKALELDPLSGEAYTTSAFLHWNQDDIETAEREFLKAIELNSNYISAHHWYANMLVWHGRFEEGLAQFRIAVELDPLAPIIQSELARAIWYTGRVEEALTVIRRNIEQNPVFPKNYYLMAGFQTELGHLGEAQRWAEEALKLNSQGAENWEQECLGFLHLGEVLLAEDCANQFSELNPGGVRALNTLRWLHLYRGEWDAAIANVESELQQTFGSRRQTMYLADLIARQGDFRSARRLMADAFPEYLEDELELGATELDVALTFAAILHVTKETRRRDVLLLAIEQQMATMHRIRGAGYGTTDAYIQAMRGNRVQAIAALREAIKLGWRASWYWLGREDFWWLLRQDWKLGSLRQDSEFIAIMNELEADIKVQRQLYEENKGKPLF